MCEWNLKKKFYLGAFFLKIGGIFIKNWGHFFQIGGNGANVLVEFEKKNLTGGIFFKNWGHFFSKLGANNYFGIEKISFFGNYMDP